MTGPNTCEGARWLYEILAYKMISKDLQEALDAAGVPVMSPNSHDAVDGLLPAVVAHPRSPEEVAATLAQASKRDLAVVPRGGGTQMELGFPPNRVDLLLSTRGLAEILDYQPEDMTVTSQAGVTLAQLDRLLATHGQRLPLEPPLPDRATLGGLVSASSCGPRRHAYGSVRDWLLGLRVALPDGTLVKGGGRVVKNVAGYDITRLYTGALGTLGIVVEVTFKVLPLPEVIAGMLVSAADPDALEPALAALSASELLPACVEMLNPAFSERATGTSDSWALVCAFEGDEEQVEWQMDRCRSLLQSVGLSSGSALQGEPLRIVLSMVADLPVMEAGMSLKITCPSSRACETFALLESACAQHGLSCLATGRAGVCVLYAAIGNGDDAPEALLAVLMQVRSAVVASGGSVVIISGTAELREDADVWGPLRPDFRLTQAIKMKFDPKGIMNPGRFLGHL
jgi:glycolate oxidase FAD binding subunit